MGGFHEKLKLPLSHHPAHGVLAMFGAVLGWSAGVPQFEVMPKGRNIRQIKAEMSCLGMNGP